MGTKPPKKTTRPNTPDTQPPARNTSTEDGTIPRHYLPDSTATGPASTSSGSQRAEIESDNIPRQPQVTVAEEFGSGQVASQFSGLTSDVSFLPPSLVASLSTPQANGIRYGKRQMTYAEIENEGITSVRRRDDGEYQASSANELIPSGPVLERIGETAFWRRKKPDVRDTTNRTVKPQPASSTDEQPGPSSSKRPRLDEDDGNLAETHPLLVGLLTQPASPQDLSLGSWRNWGSSTKPQSVESLEINGLHYRVVPHGSPEQTGLAFVEHPRFSPSRYEAFEQMLQDDPSLQPRWAAKRNGEWQVLEGHLPFERSLTGYVAQTFRDLSDASLNTVARAVFNRANDSHVINSQGLMVLKQSFRNWADATSAQIPRPELADPLLMLPITTRTTSTAWLALPPADADATLRRLDFAPIHFPTEWNNFSANPSSYNLKRLVGSVLVRNGYEVFPLTNEHQGPTLVFTRANHDSVFFLKLGRVEGHAVRDITPPGHELSDPDLTAQIGVPARTALLAAHDQNKVVWLLGGTQTATFGWQSVFIIRER